MSHKAIKGEQEYPKAKGQLTRQQTAMAIRNRKSLNVNKEYKLHNLSKWHDNQIDVMEFVSYFFQNGNCHKTYSDAVITGRISQLGKQQ